MSLCRHNGMEGNLASGILNEKIWLLNILCITKTKDKCARDPPLTGTLSPEKGLKVVQNMSSKEI